MRQLDASSHLIAPPSAIALKAANPYPAFLFIALSGRELFGANP
jgi:hypothetical protein